MEQSSVCQGRRRIRRVASNSWAGLAECALLALSLLVALASPCSASDLEILAGSRATLGGAQRTIVEQVRPLANSPQTTMSFRSLDVMTLPQFSYFVGEFVDIFQNQELVGMLDPDLEESSLSFPLWVLDSDGDLVELTAELTTGVPDSMTCQGGPFCLGLPGEPDHCKGMPWNPQTGELTYVGVTLIPPDSGIFLPCDSVKWVVNARILPGDADGDMVEDAIDRCPDDATTGQTDVDGDGVGDGCDNCPSTSNRNQADDDGDGAGNACEPRMVNFQPAAAPVVPDYDVDAGGLFSLASGYGWLGNNVLQVRDREEDADQLLDTLVLADPIRFWEGEIRGGWFDVEIVVGDSKFNLGPHRAIAEGETAFDGETTLVGEHLSALQMDRWIADGRLTIEVGGAGGFTGMNYLRATEAPIQPFYERYFNFQPPSTPIPDGFEADLGEPYDELVGFGWDGVTPVLTRDRNATDDQVLDTIAFTTSTPRTWDIAVPADVYDVEVGLGDPNFGQGPQTVIVEGELWISGAFTAAGESLTLRGAVRVLDESLTIEIGEPGGSTVLNHVGIAASARDLDGDGFTNLDDVCYRIPDPGQEDTDGNGVGDACNDHEDADGDEWADALDNCPSIPNGSQGNMDSDNRGDLCDCAPEDGSAYAVPEVVTNFKITLPLTALSWDAQNASAGNGTVYDVVWMSTDELRTTQSLAGAQCLSGDVGPSPVTFDSRTPPSGDGYLYLVRAENACGSSTYGSGDGVPDPRATLDTSPVCP
ncbi:MAG: hypothetical protein GY716_04495 [bacterium]|nr:hypothetical protein [bacterium]